MNKLNIDIRQVENAEEALGALLAGAELSHFQTYSLVLNLCFRKLPKTDNLPVEVWLSATGRATFIAKTGVPTNNVPDSESDDFFDSREKLLGQLYRLIGKEITEIDIDPSGILELSFEKGNLIFAGDETDLEEIWSVTSDTPEPYAKHDWAVTLTDERELVTRRP